jgi:MFS family permease
MNSQPAEVEGHELTIVEIKNQQQISERTIIRKIDLHVIPLIVCFYLLSFLDRTNIGNARLSGLTTDLNLTDYQYRIALTILYVPYILAEVPSNLLVKKIGPNYWLPILVTCWGIVGTLQGIVVNAQGLWADRFFLGLTEGGILPGIILYLSGWYKPHELQFRIGLFWSASSVAGAFAGLFAAAIGLINNAGGLHGWSWIFIIEGIITVIVGIIGFFVMPSSISKAKFLTAEEQTFANERLINASGGHNEEEENFRWSEVLSVFTSFHMYLLLILSFCSGIAVYSVAYFLPTILSDFGYSTWVTQLLTVPPYVLSFILTFVCSIWSDRIGQRSPFIIFPHLLAIAGTAILYTCTRDGRGIGPRYFAIFLVVGGIYSAVPAYLAWASNNFSPHYRRATALGCMIVMTNSGGLASTWLFRSADSPIYNTGYAVMLALLALGTIVPILLRYYFIYVNRQRKNENVDAGQPEPNAVEKHEQNNVLTNKGDRSKNFLYTI